MSSIILYLLLTILNQTFSLFEKTSVFGSIGNQIYSAHTSSNNIVLLVNTSQPLLHVHQYYFDQSTAIWSFTSNPVNLPSSFKIKSAQFNKNQSSACYLAFDNTQVFVYKNNFLNSTLIYSSLIKIVDATFGQNDTEVYMLTIQSILTINTFVVIRLVGSILVGTYIQNQVSLSEKVKMHYRNNKLYLQMENYIKVMRFNNFNATSLSLYSTVLSPFYDFQRVGISLSQDGLWFAYYTPDYLILLDALNFTLLGNISFYSDLQVPNDSFIYDMRFGMPKNYFLFSIQRPQGNLLYQYDFDIRMIISSIIVVPLLDSNTSFYKLQLLVIRDSQEIVCSPKLSRAIQMIKYRVTYIYQCDNMSSPNGDRTCTFCQSTYGINNLFLCEKNFTSSANSTIQLVSVTQTLKKKLPLVSTIQQLVNEQKFNLSLNYTAKILTFSVARIFAKSFLSIICFLEDLQLYSYHNKQYPDILQLFTSKVNLVNEIRLAPWYLDFANEVSSIIQNSTKLYQDQNNLWVAQLQLHSHSNPSEVYFMTSSTPILADAIINTGLFFLVLKVLHLVFYLLRHSCSLFKSFYEKLKHETMWWTILVGVLELNMTNLSFNCSTQLLLMSSLNPMNKFNAVLTLLMLFSLLTYSTSFYLTIKKFYKMKQAQILLQRLSGINKNFLMEPIILLLRNFLRSSVTGLFINHQHWQIFSLAILDLMLLILLIKTKKLFKNKGSFFFTFAYFFSFLSLDLFLFLMNLREMSETSSEISCFVFLSAAVVSCILIYFSLILPEILQTIKTLSRIVRKRNQVAPQGEDKFQSGKANKLNVKNQSQRNNQNHLQDRKQFHLAPVTRRKVKRHRDNQSLNLKKQLHKNVQIFQELIWQH